jgi:hypothetical protein
VFVSLVLAPAIVIVMRPMSAPLTAQTLSQATEASTFQNTTFVVRDGLEAPIKQCWVGKDDPRWQQEFGVLADKPKADDKWAARPGDHGPKDQCYNLPLHTPFRSAKYGVNSQVAR